MKPPNNTEQTMGKVLTIYERWLHLENPDQPDTPGNNIEAGNTGVPMAKRRAAAAAAPIAFATAKVVQHQQQETKTILLRPGRHSFSVQAGASGRCGANPSSCSLEETLYSRSRTSLLVRPYHLSRGNFFPQRTHTHTDRHTGHS